MKGGGEGGDDDADTIEMITYGAGGVNWDSRGAITQWIITNQSFHNGGENTRADNMEEIKNSGGMEWLNKVWIAWSGSYS